MNPNTPVYYQGSNQFNIPKLIIALVLCFLITIVAAYVYTLLVVMLPFVYFRVGVTLVFGVGMSYVVRLLTRMGHIRSRKNRYGLVLITLLFLTYFQWVAFLLYAYDMRLPSFGHYLSNLDLFFSMEGVFAFVAEINEFGIWELFGTTLNGTFWTIIWSLEFLIIMITLFMFTAKARIYPYADDKEQWYKKYTLEENYKVGSLLKLTEGLHEDALKTIQALDYGSGRRYAKIHLYYLERSTYHYLDVEKVSIDNEGKEDADLLIEALRIDNKTAKSLLDNIEHKQERIEIF